MPARSAQAMLNSYAVSHVPPLAVTAPPAYFMMPAQMAYPWAPAPQIYDNDEEQKQPEEEDILMQRFGGWN